MAVLGVLTATLAAGAPAQTNAPTGSAPAPWPATPA